MSVRIATPDLAPTSAGRGSMSSTPEIEAAKQKKRKVEDDDVEEEEEVLMVSTHTYIATLCTCLPSYCIPTVIPIC